MKIRVSKIFLISLVWFLFILLHIFFPNSIGNSHNNGYYIVVSGAICYIMYPKAIVAVITILVFCILYIISTDIIHPIGDAATIMMCLSSLAIAMKSKYTKKELCYLFFMLSVFILIDTLGIFIPDMYDREDSDSIRYLGVLHGANLTVTIFGLAQIAVYELRIRNKYIKKYLCLNIILFSVMFLATRTRSLVFFLPYWTLQIYRNVNKRTFYLLCSIIMIFVLIGIGNILSTLRFDELDNDGSYLTRMFLYESMLEGIKDNFFLIPHGSNSANLLSKKVTMDDDFAAHNDLLLYWYDWGIIFIFLLCYGYRQIRKNIKIDWTYIFIIFAWSSACLHNVFLLPMVYFLFLICTNLYFNNISICQKKQIRIGKE